MKLRFVLMSLAALLVLVLDQITKLWISSSMQVGQSTSLIEGYIRLRYTQNTGAAFGIFSDSTGILSIVSLVVIVGIVVAFVRLGNPTWLSVLAAGLVLGGALGNLADRVRLGYVVDFVEVFKPQLNLNNVVYTFPVFNAADSAITVGVVLILIGLLFGKTGEPAPSGAEIAAPPAGTDLLPSSPAPPAEPDTDSKGASLAGR
jgi:signal peptidase II